MPSRSHVPLSRLRRSTRPVGHLPTTNGCAAFGSYRVDPAGGCAPWAIQIIEVSDGKITGHHNFVDPALFGPFGLPDRLDP